MKQVSELTVDLINAALKEDGRFEQLKMLGKGSFGCVCQARNLENDEIVAIKFLPRLEVRGMGMGGLAHSRSVVHGDRLLVSGVNACCEPTCGIHSS